MMRFTGSCLRPMRGHTRLLPHRGLWRSHGRSGRGRQVAIRHCLAVRWSSTESCFLLLLLLLLLLEAALGGEPRAAFLLDDGVGALQPHTRLLGLLSPHLPVTRSQSSINDGGIKKLDGLCAIGLMLHQVDCCTCMSALSKQAYPVMNNLGVQCESADATSWAGGVRPDART